MALIGVNILYIQRYKKLCSKCVIKIVMHSTVVYLKKKIEAGDVAQVVVRSPSMREALDSILSTT